MLDPSWPGTPVVLWVAVAALVALLTVRAIRRGGKDYREFKRYRTTTKRQAMYRKWLISAVWTFGGLGLVLLALAGAFVGPLLTEVRRWVPVSPVVALVALVVLVAAGVVITVVALRAMRGSDEPMLVVGDIRALFPRNRQELRLGWLMSLNAGVSEELMFRLAIPAALYGASGSAVVAVVVSLLLFGALHLYQGVWGVVGTLAVGTFLFAIYAATGWILVPMVLHALIDLRSFVLLPTMMFGAHRIDGRTHPRIAMNPVPVTARPAENAAAAGGADAAFDESSSEVPPVV